MTVLRLVRAVAFLLVLSLLVLPSGVSAAGPEIIRGGEAYSFTIPANEHPCGVEVVIEGEFRFTDRLFFDDAGNLVKVISTVSDRWTETGPGGTVQGQANVTVVTTNIASSNGVETWTDSFRGLPIKFSAPGFGVVVRDAGILTVNRSFALNDPDDPEDDEFSQEVIFEGGFHPTFYGPEGWGDDFCALVTG